MQEHRLVVRTPNEEISVSPKDKAFHAAALALINELIEVIPGRPTQRRTYIQALESIRSLLDDTKKNNLILPSHLFECFELIKDGVRKYETPRKLEPFQGPTLFPMLRNLQPLVATVFQVITQKVKDSLALKLLQSEYDSSLHSVTTLPTDVISIITSYASHYGCAADDLIGLCPSP